MFTENYMIDNCVLLRGRRRREETHLSDSMMILLYKYSGVRKIVRLDLRLVIFVQKKLHQMLQAVVSLQPTGITASCLMTRDDSPVGDPTGGFPSLVDMGAMSYAPLRPAPWCLAPLPWLSLVEAFSGGGTQKAPASISL